MADEKASYEVHGGSFDGDSPPRRGSKVVGGRKESVIAEAYVVVADSNCWGQWTDSAFQASRCTETFTQLSSTAT